MTDLIPLREAAREFGVHRNTLLRHLKIGNLTGYAAAIGRTVYVDRDQLRDLVEPKPIQPQPPAKRRRPRK